MILKRATSTSFSSYATILRELEDLRPAISDSVEAPGPQIEPK
jgi:hypothetical protein